MTVFAIIGLIIGFAALSVDGIAAGLVGAWIGLGIGGNVPALFAEMGYGQVNSVFRGIGKSWVSGRNDTSRAVIYD